MAGEKVSGWLKDLKSTGGFGVDPEILEAARVDFESERVTDAETLKVIKTVYETTKEGYILDPHSAVGVAATLRSIERFPPPETHHISLATAHPAKFSGAVQLALEKAPGFKFDDMLPEQFVGLEDLPRRVKQAKKSEGLEGLKKLIIEELLTERHIANGTT